MGVLDACGRCMMAHHTDAAWSDMLRSAASPYARGVVLRVVFHPKQLMLITAGEDAEVRVWDLVDKSCVATLKARPLSAGA